MSRGSVRLLTFGSGRRELGFEFSLRGADEISTPTFGPPGTVSPGPFRTAPKTAQIAPDPSGPQNLQNLIMLLITKPSKSGRFPNRRIWPLDPAPPGTSDLDLPTDPLEELPSVQNFQCLTPSACPSARSHLVSTAPSGRLAIPTKRQLRLRAAARS